MARILIVEDNAVNRRLVAAMLGNEHTIVTAETLAQGREAIRRDGVDLVLLDLGLPDGNGIELLKEACSEREIPVVVISAYDTPAWVKQGYALGCAEYLVKPVQRQQLLRAVEVLTS